MRALVTGAPGFVGTHLVRALLEDGIEVWAGGHQGQPPGVGTAAARWIDLDVTDPASITDAVAVANPNQVYHLAGQSSVA